MKKNCVRCLIAISSLKNKYLKQDGVVCKNCYEKEYRKLNKDRLNKWHKQYDDSNRDTINKQARDRYSDPSNGRKQKQKQWNQENPEYIRVRARLEYKKKYKIDAQWTAARCIRRRFAAALKNKSKNSPTWSYIGCSYEEFVSHLESKFQPGMTWANYGFWEIDHIAPLFKFDLTKDDQILLAWHYSNMQPLWKKDHLEKTKKDLYGQR